MAYAGFVVSLAAGLYAVYVRDGGWAFWFGSLTALNGLFALGVLK
jgi:hypothetical protein